MENDNDAETGTDVGRVKGDFYIVTLLGISGVDNTFVVSDRSENTMIIKDRPVLNNQHVDLLL